MWNSRLFWKLFLLYGGLIFLIAATFPLALSSWEEEKVVDQARDRLSGIAVMLRRAVDAPLQSGEHARLQEMVDEVAELTDVRITLIAGDGRVIAETQQEREVMQNHRNRPELIAAARSGRGEAQRRSPTLGTRMFYFALPVRGQENPAEVSAFVRVAVALQPLEAEAQARQRTLWLVALGIAALSAPIVYWFVGRIVQPLTELTESSRAISSGDYERPVTLRSQDELGQLAAAFNQMRVELAGRIAQLQEHNRQMATVLRGMAEGVLAVDAQRRVLLANDACRSLLSFAGGDFVGRPLLEVARHVEIDAIVSAALAEAQPCQREISLPGPPRRMIRLFATRLPADPSPGVVIVMHDITELRRLENLRRDFVANVSHELKTPLAAIKAYAETLRMGALDDPDHNHIFIDRISEQAEQLHHLIIDLLQLARVETGEEALEVTEVDLGECVEQCVSQYRQLAEGKHIDLQLVPPEERIILHADRQGVSTILSNLLSNAINYTPAKGRVTVRWTWQPPQAVIEIEDTGLGIADDEQQRVFERFYRVDKARSREVGGTGLGLSIVKHLAQSFGGSVDLRSQPGAGSTFRVHLPATTEVPV